ncbi:sensor histidine kinase [Parafrigoribacterium soli]|uniref:sensor histidine kinase n=1 Tax=Parafrigoribacterium soli TaxID=3144663 RepID=UPI0032EF120E
MDTWLRDNSLFLAVTLAVVAGVLLVLTLLFLVLWLRSSRRRRNLDFDRIDAEDEVTDLEIALQEQLSRLRIVRELHEVAVHSVSVIISQADGARYTASADPSAAARSAATIAETARATLADLRRVMTVVREGEADASPQPRLKSARELFKAMRDAGLVLTFVESGDRFELQRGAELAVYRILQEALSNALKYGGEGTEVKVSFTWTEEGLQLLVDDDGVRAEARRQGLDPNAVAQKRSYTFEEDLNALTDVITGPGMTEMRERAELFGGIFNAYAVPGVGFSVSAVFPALRYDNGVHGVKLER